jgi:hypothetical protein
LEGYDFNRDAVQQDIFTLAAAKFDSLPDHATTQLLRAAFEKSTPLDTFSRELLEATTTHILLGGGGVSIKLKNLQIIGKDEENADNSRPGENRAQDPGEA